MAFEWDAGGFAELWDLLEKIWGHSSVTRDRFRLRYYDESSEHTPVMIGGEEDFLHAVDLAELKARCKVRSRHPARLSLLHLHGYALPK